MEHSLTLTDAEAEFLRELLEEERRDLAGMIHHAGSWDVREDLRARQKTVDELLGRLGTPAAHS